MCPHFQKSLVNDAPPLSKSLATDHSESENKSFPRKQFCITTYLFQEKDKCEDLVKYDADVNNVFASENQCPAGIWEQEPACVKRRGKRH